MFHSADTDILLATFSNVISWTKIWFSDGSSNGLVLNRWQATTGIARHRGFASLTHSKSQSRIVVTSAAAHGRIVKTVKKVTTYMVGTVKRQNTSSSERSWRKIAKTRQSLFRKSTWSGYSHKMCAVDSNTKRLYSNEMSDRSTHFTVFMIMNCPVEQQILAAYGSIVDSRRIFARVSLYLNYSFRKLRMPPKRKLVPGAGQGSLVSCWAKRQTLSVSEHEELMRVMIQGGNIQDFPFHQAVSRWAFAKQRVIYQAKETGAK